MSSTRMLVYDTSKGYYVPVNSSGNSRMDANIFTSTALDVQSSTLATEASLSALNGKVTACDTGAVVITSGSVTETNSASILADTASLDSKLPSQGQAVKAASLPVTLASDQGTLAVSDSAIVNCDTSNVVISSGSVTETNSASILVDTTAIKTSLQGTLTVAQAKDNTASSLWSSQSIGASSSANTASVDMTLHSKIQVYGETTNTTDTTIYMEVSDDNTNWYRHTEKLVLVDGDGKFGCIFSDVSTDYVRFYKFNNGAAETITLKVTKMK